MYTKKRALVLTKARFVKSGDDLLSHNVAGKRVNTKPCLSVCNELEQLRETNVATTVKPANA